MAAAIILRKNAFCTVGKSPESFTKAPINENPSADTNNNRIHLLRSDIRRSYNCFIINKSLNISYYKIRRMEISLFTGDASHLPNSINDTLGYTYYSCQLSNGYAIQLF